MSDVGSGRSAAAAPRVLYVAHGHPDQRPGGAESCALQLYDAMRAAATFEPWLLTAAVGPIHAGTPLSTNGVDPHQLQLAGGDYDPFWGRLRDRRRGTQDFAELLRQLRPEVVHFHHLHNLGFDLLWVVRQQLPAAAIVFTLHDYVPICAAHGQLLRVPTRERCLSATPQRCHQCIPDRAPGRHFLRTRWVQAALRCVDRFVAPSAFLRQRYVDWGLPAARIQVLENARAAHDDAACWTPAAGDPPRRFGYFGQVSEVKGALLLLRAAQLLHQRGVDVDIEIHGANLELQPPPFQAVFRRELQRCPTTLRLLPPYALAEVDRRMRAVDWVVVPSEWWENSPLVIQEAFLNERPVICADIGGMAEKVRHGVDGLHFAAGSHAALAAVMAQAAAARTDWQRLARATRRPPSPAEAAAAHTAIYRQLLAARAAAAASGPVVDAAAATAITEPPS